MLKTLHLGTDAPDLQWLLVHSFDNKVEEFRARWAELNKREPEFHPLTLTEEEWVTQFNLFLAFDYTRGYNHE